LEWLGSEEESVEVGGVLGEESSDLEGALAGVTVVTLTFVPRLGRREVVIDSPDHGCLLLPDRGAVVASVGEAESVVSSGPFGHGTTESLVVGFGVHESSFDD
jgi:hypothetical protein